MLEALRGDAALRQAARGLVSAAMAASNSSVAACVPAPAIGLLNQDRCIEGDALNGDAPEWTATIQRPATAGATHYPKGIGSEDMQPGVKEKMLQSKAIVQTGGKTLRIQDAWAVPRGVWKSM